MRYEAAAAAESGGRIAESWRDYERLEEDDADGGFGDAAGRGIWRLASKARRELLRAETYAVSDVGAAEGVLDEASARFAGTPVEMDFRAVRESLERTGRFPKLLRRRTWWFRRAVTRGGWRRGGLGAPSRGARDGMTVLPCSRCLGRCKAPTL